MIVDSSEPCVHTHQLEGNLYSVNMDTKLFFSVVVHENCSRSERNWTQFTSISHAVIHLLDGNRNKHVTCYATRTAVTPIELHSSAYVIARIDVIRIKANYPLLLSVFHGFPKNPEEFYRRPSVCAGTPVYVELALLVKWSPLSPAHIFPHCHECPFRHIWIHFHITAVRLLVACNL